MVARKKSENDSLVEDLKSVIHDAEEILNATAEQTGDKISALRARTTENLRQMRQKLGIMENDLLNRAKATVRSTDQLIHEKPWQSVAIAGGIGLLLGMLAGRR